jgi:hypothetical protein
VPDSSYEMILAIPPAMVAPEGGNILSGTVETSLFRPSNLYPLILADSGRSLKPGGQLVIWLRIPLVSFHSFMGFINVAAKNFHMTSASTLADGIESFICLGQEQSMMGRWMYKLKKSGISHDALWMILSFTRTENSLDQKKNL